MYKAKTEDCHNKGGICIQKLETGLNASVCPKLNIDNKEINTETLGLTNLPIDLCKVEVQRDVSFHA